MACHLRSDLREESPLDKGTFYVVELQWTCNDAQEFPFVVDQDVLDETSEFSSVICIGGLWAMPTLRSGPENREIAGSVNEREASARVHKPRWMPELILTAPRLTSSWIQSGVSSHQSNVGDAQYLSQTLHS